MVSAQQSVTQLEDKLWSWAAKLDELAAKADKIAGEAGLDLHQRIDALAAKRALAQEKFDEFKAAGSADWEEFRDGIEGAWREFETALRAHL